MDHLGIVEGLFGYIKGEEPLSEYFIRGECRGTLLSIFLIGLPDCHKPHPSPILKPYQINQVLDVLHQEGLL